MRIISGDLGGRRFNPPNEMPYTRPTTDMAKEGLFNVIQNNIDISSASTLDLFGGTGSISYELYSRGARDLVIVEKDAEMLQFIKKTADFLKIEGLQIMRSDVFKFLNTCSQTFDFIFAGPPYALGNIEDIPRIIFQRQLLKTKGWFVLEHTPRNDFRAFPYFFAERKYGTTLFSIFIFQTAEPNQDDQK